VCVSAFEWGAMSADVVADSHGHGSMGWGNPAVFSVAIGARAVLVQSPFVLHIEAQRPSLKSSHAAWCS